MCGIIGIIGNQPASELLVDGLKRLEYRGYDSAGVATLVDGEIDRRRAAGKLVNLDKLVKDQPLPGITGIGHTRWATHGSPSIANAHPHSSDLVSLVHNGIIENHSELRAELAADGYTFESETDSEVIVHLFHSFVASSEDKLVALQKTVARLRGAYFNAHRGVCS